MKRTAVILVTYNRWEYLAASLNATLSQLGPGDAVFVVDNGSTDGTRERLPVAFPSVTLLMTQSNLGGAGGFSYGVDLAIAEGFELAWLVDDDGEPEPDAYQELLAVREAHPNAPFWASTTWFYDGTIEQARRGEHIRPAVAGTEARTGAIDTLTSTFVGVLVDLSVAAKQPLPMADFFIWHDDSEYTARLSAQRPGVRALASRILHPYKAEYADFGPRLRYDVRNRLWILRNSTLGAAWLRREQVRVLPRIIAKQALKSKRKSVYFSSLATGLREGLLSRPRLYNVGDLVREWSVQRVDGTSADAGDGAQQVP